MNGFGFVQLVARLERPSLLHRAAFQRAGLAARALLRRAEQLAGRRRGAALGPPRARSPAQARMARRARPPHRPRSALGGPPGPCARGAASPTRAAMRNRPCPICRKPRAEEFAPFCSSRCRDLDLAPLVQRRLRGARPAGRPGRPRQARTESLLPTPRPFAIGAPSYRRTAVKGRVRVPARVAQLVEHATENRSVGGSTPSPGTTPNSGTFGLRPREPFRRPLRCAQSAMGSLKGPRHGPHPRALLLFLRPHREDGRRGRRGGS